MGDIKKLKKINYFEMLRSQSLTTFLKIDNKY